MAEFGSEVTEAPDIVAAESPREGVVEQPVALDGIANIFDVAAGFFEGRKESKRNAAVADFTRRQLLVADAYEQGRIKSQAEARTLLRKNLLDMIESNPDDADFALELVSAQNKILGISGGAKIIDGGTEEDNRKQAVRDSLVNSGVVRADASEQQFEQAEQLFRQQALAQEKYDQQIKTINLAKSTLELESSQMANQERKEELATREFLQDSSQGELLGYEAKLREIVEGDGTAADKTTAIDQLHKQFVAQVNPILARLPSDERGLYTQPFEQTRDLYRSLATGERDLADVENRNKLIRENQENLLLSDPRLAKLAVASEMFNFGAFDFPIQADIYERVTAVIGNNQSTLGGEKSPGVASPNNPFDGDKKTAEAYETTLNLVLKGLESGDENVVNNSLDHLNALLGNFVGGEASVRGVPKDAVEIVRVLANPRYAKVFQEHSESLTNLEGANQVIQTHFNDEVWGMVQREFTNNKIVPPPSVSPSSSLPFGSSLLELGGDREATKEAVTYKTTSAGMEFVAVDPKNDQAVKKARDLNNTLKPAINTTVQAWSHLNGNTDYGKAWESVAEDILGTSLEGEDGGQELAGGDAGDDLVFEDFVFPSVSSEGLPEEVANDEVFLSMTEELASKYDIDPSVLLAIMDFETGGTFNPAQKNAAGSSATGLIQFMSSTAKNLGTTVEELEKMTRAEQLPFVEKYLDQFSSKIRGKGASDVYMAVLFPKAINKSDDFVLFREGTKAYSQNKGLDSNGDGTVTKAEASRKVVSLVGKHET